MYPNLFYAFKDLFGIEIPGLKIVNSFGFFVALSFLISAWFLSRELKRKQAQGIFTYKETEIIIGKSASLPDLLLNFVLGFILGYKLLGVFIIKDALTNPQEFIFSSNGSVTAGILLGLFFAVLKWWEKNKNKLPSPEKRIVRIWPSDKVGDIVIIAAVAGFLGAKIFDNFENWDRFMQDPIGNLISPSGLTFYGGLIVATLALWFYFYKNNIRFIDVADAAAPCLMLAYGLGRIGCQVAGDGDWGIINTAFVSDPAGNMLPAPDSSTYIDVLKNNESFYTNQFGSLLQVQHASLKPFWHLPDWFFAYTYPHNVNNEGIPLVPCTWDNYCNHLPLPVFPTPLYEIIMGLLLFALLWSIRKKFKLTGRMFAVYLVLNGIERFTIEQIRVNNKISFAGINPTQAEIIAVGLMITGVLLYMLAPKIQKPKPSPA